MARARFKLSAAGVTAFVKSGANGSRLGDGAGLYLSKAKGGSVAWTFQYMREGKRSELGLGGYPDTSLADARLKAEAHRKLLASGVDPRAAKREQAEAQTFKQAAEDYYNAFSDGWKTDTMRTEWTRTLKLYLTAIHDVKIKDLGVDDVLKVVRPLSTTKPTIAKYVLSMIRRTVDRASMTGHRDPNSINPATWDRIKLVLPIKHKTKHHKATPYQDVPALMKKLQASDSVINRALEMIALTGARKHMVLGMTYDQLDMKACTWTVPAHLMKGKRDHVTPLTRRALDIIRTQIASNSTRDAVTEGGATIDASNTDQPLSGHVFVNKKGKPLSLGTFTHLEFNGTPHGLRSALRDYLGNETPTPREIAEEILAHTLSTVEGSYRRQAALTKRGQALKLWHDYICPPAAV